MPLLLFMGDRDENDSVEYDDGYDAEDRDLIDELFGEQPVDRWEHARQIYAAAGLDAEFRLYPGVGHEMSPEMIQDATAFLRQQLESTN